MGRVFTVRIFFLFAMVLILGALVEKEAAADHLKKTDSGPGTPSPIPPDHAGAPKPDEKTEHITGNEINDKDALQAFTKAKKMWREVDDDLKALRPRLGEKRLIGLNQPPLGCTCASKSGSNYSLFAAIAHIIDPDEYNSKKPPLCIISKYSNKERDPYFYRNRNADWADARREINPKLAALQKDREENFKQYKAWESSNNYHSAQNMAAYKTKIDEIDKKMLELEAVAERYIADEKEDAKDYYEIIDAGEKGKRIKFRAPFSFAKLEEPNDVYRNRRVYSRAETVLEGGKEVEYENVYEVATETDGNVVVHKEKFKDGKSVEETVCW